jgi:hypothetical protein
MGLIVLPSHWRPMPVHSDQRPGPSESTVTTGSRLVNLTFQISNCHQLLVVYSLLAAYQCFVRTASLC